MMKLEVGQVFKNVKFVGEWLGEVVLTKVQTKTKNKWLKELDRYCKWHKKGQKIIIDEVYEIPLEKVDGRSTNTFAEGTRHTQESFYKEYLKEIIIESLSELKKDEVNFQGSMYKMLGRQKVFTKYFFGEHNNPLIKHYLTNVGGKIYKPFQNALEELAVEGKIKYAKVMLFKFEDEDEDLLPDYLVPLYEEAYKYAEKKTGLVPFTKYSFVLSNITAFRTELINYMNKHKEGLYDKDIIRISNPYIIEKGVKFESCLMPVENKMKFINNIHKQVITSKNMKEKIDTLEVKSFGKNKQEVAKEIFDKCYNTLFYTGEIEQMIKKEKEAIKIEKEIKFHALHSDSYIAIREIGKLNEEYYELMKKDSNVALEFFDSYEAEKIIKEEIRREEEEDYEYENFKMKYNNRIETIPMKTVVNDNLDYLVWLAQSI